MAHQEFFSWNAYIWYMLTQTAVKKFLGCICVVTDWSCMKIEDTLILQNIKKNAHTL